MNSWRKASFIIGAAIAACVATPSQADEFSFQGKLLDGDAPANGTYDLIFDLYDASAGGNLEGSDSVLGVTVTDGLFTVDLDFGAGTFDGSEERWVEISVDDGGGAVLLSPRQPVLPAPRAHYATLAGTAANFSGDGNSISNLNASNVTRGNLPAAQMPTGGNWGLASNLSVDAGTLFLNPTSNQVGIGTTTPTAGFALHTNGNVQVGPNDAGARVTLEAAASVSRGWGSDGAGANWAIGGSGFGQIWLHNGEAGNPITVDLSGGFGAPSYLSLRDLAGVEQALMSGGGTLSLSDSATVGDTAGAHSRINDVSQGSFRTYGSDGLEQITIHGTAWGQIQMRDSTGNNVTVQMNANANSGGSIELFDLIGAERVQLDALSNHGTLTLDQTDASIGAVLDGDRGTNVGGSLTLRDNLGNTRIELNGQDAANTGGDMFGYNNSGVQTIDVDTDFGGGGLIQVRNAAGSSTIQLWGDFSGGDSRIIADVVQINGGADLSEQFDVASRNGEEIEPGMVVSIDPDNVGKLLVSEGAYDRTVAGIISGAGGVRPGMLMGQEGSEADGQLPIALTGRVYVWCDASNGSIQPGDLLTTSHERGHAMKVSDYSRAQGAIIGKAMSSLDEDRGLVLVLVSLQ